MFYQLPPAGNPVLLSDEPSVPALLENLFLPYLPRYYASGTAALAAAITAAKLLKPVDNPEVLLPAYGCPDLVSAAEYAGARPVLIDLEKERPWMDLGQLSANIGPSTVAIVAVNLFGIPERIEKIQSIARQADVLLIEDSAQAFPHDDEEGYWKGDMVVVSFGRGKPVSLLGGGAVLYRKPGLAELLPEVAAAPVAGLSRRLLFRLKASLYNLLISPRLYWLPQGLPFLHLGETRYHPLLAIECMDQAKQAILPANIMAYKNNTMKSQQALTRMIRELGSAAGVIDLPSVCNMPQNRRLLRYPVLVQSSLRDRLCHKLRKLGLGASTMYPSALSGMPGLETILSGQTSFPAAEAFAARILTLPTHMHVRIKDVESIRQVLSNS